ncbi:hypothetical protein [Arthrobacter monumenti]
MSSPSSATVDMLRALPGPGTSSAQGPLSTAASLSPRAQRDDVALQVDTLVEATFSTRY